MKLYWGIRDFLRDDSGASASEYAVLVALVVAAVAAAISAFDLNVFFGVRDRVMNCANSTNGTC